MDQADKGEPRDAGEGSFALIAGVAGIAAFAWLVAVPPTRSMLPDQWGGSEDRAEAMQIVRDTLAGRPRRNTPRPALREHRRVWVTLFSAGAASVHAGKGTDVALALADAASSLFSGPPVGQWIRVDVETAEAPLPFAPSQESLEVLFEPGIDGILAQSGGAEAAVMPGDIVSGEWFTPDHLETRGAVAVKAIAAARARLGPITTTDLELARIRTDSFVAPRRDDGQAPLPLFRGFPAADEFSPMAVRRAVEEGMDWLAHDVGADGRFRWYTYIPGTDRPDPELEPYNVTRHLAAAWILERLGRRAGRADWSEAGKRSARWIEQFVQASAGDRDGVTAPGSTPGALGDTAMAVLALAEGGVPPSQAARLGSTLEWMQRPDGGFYDDAAEATARPAPPGNTLLYEPGEALLALVTLAEEQPAEAHWLASAQRAAGYLAGRFETVWRTGSPELADRVHWEAQALERLYRLDHQRRWAEVAVDMGTAILRTGTPPILSARTPTGWLIGPVQTDYLGSYPPLGRPPRVGISGARAEGLNAARRAAILLGRDPAPFESALLLSAQFQLRNQYRDPGCYFCLFPDHAAGAFRSGLIDGEVRIDVVQHVAGSLADTLQWYGASPSGGSSDR